MKDRLESILPSGTIRAITPSVLLITVSAPEIRRIRKSRFINFQQCTMPYLAALFPEKWNIEHIDEECEPINYNAHYDIVGMTFHTPSALHAYDIAQTFKEKGSLVIMGGPHVTLNPEEATEHADVVFVGEAEHTLPEFIEDYFCGKEKARYDCIETPDLKGIPFSKKELFHRKDYSAGIMTATRGCPNSCEFCTLAVMYKKKFRRRPIEEVAAEYASFKGKVIIFWDDNITGDMKYAKDLCRALTPYRKWWSSQASIMAGYDHEFLELAAKSGCKQLFIGFESISQSSLDGCEKGFNKVADYKKVVENIHSHGISVQAGFVFGFDEDLPDIFDRTLLFLDETGVQNATFNMLIPYPGTPLFKRLDSENRILSYDWSKYNGRKDVVFSPKNFSREDLLAGFNKVNKHFYSYGSILRRLKKSPVELFWTLPLNLIYHIKLNSTM